jgi:hypothetical protein
LNPRPLGYEPYDMRLCRLGQSLPGGLKLSRLTQRSRNDLLRLPCLSSSRSVSCTNPCTNMVSAAGPSIVGSAADMPVMASELDARAIVTSLAGRQIPTATGRPNTVLAVDDASVLVGTMRSLDGEQGDLGLARGQRCPSRFVGLRCGCDLSVDGGRIRGGCGRGSCRAGSVGGAGPVGTQAAYPWAR